MFMRTVYTFIHVQMLRNDLFKYISLGRCCKYEYSGFVLTTQSTMYKWQAKYIRMFGI